jgi:HEAT repeat protein
MTLALAACSQQRYIVQLDTTPWLHALGSDDLLESDPAEDKLVSLGADALPVLRTALEREPASVRVGIVAVLWRLQSPQAEQMLMQLAATDSDDTVRADALRALGDARNPARITTFESALRDPSARVRQAAIQACTEACTSPAAFADLADLAVRDTPGNAAWARHAIDRMLADPDNPRARAARRAIEQRTHWHAGTLPLDQQVRAALLRADIGDQAAAPTLALGARISGDLRLRQHALVALGSVGTAAQVDDLALLRRDPDQRVALYSDAALQQMAQRKVAGASEALHRHPLPPPAQPVTRPFP